MPVYVIGEVEINDPAAYGEYIKLAPPAIASYGGRYLVRGGAVEPREGDWNPARVVVLEFPTMERARSWYASPEYAPALAIRQRCAKTRMIFVEGVEPPRSVIP